MKEKTQEQNKAPSKKSIKQKIDEFRKLLLDDINDNIKLLETQQEGELRTRFLDYYNNRKATIEKMTDDQIQELMDIGYQESLKGETKKEETAEVEDEPEDEPEEAEETEKESK